MVDHLIHGIAGLHHEHDTPRALQQSNELLDGMGANDLCSFRLVTQKVIHLGNRTVEDGNLEAVVVHIEDKILSHYSEAN
jgi:hypothetical protein